MLWQLDGTENGVDHNGRQGLCNESLSVQLHPSPIEQSSPKDRHSPASSSDSSIIVAEVVIVAESMLSLFVLSVGVLGLTVVL